MSDERTISEEVNYIAQYVESQKEFTMAKKLGSTFIDLSKKKAAKLLSDALDESRRVCESMQKAAYEEGYGKGYDKGLKDALQMIKTELGDKYGRLFSEICEQYRREKENQLKRLHDDILELISIAVWLVVREKSENDHKIIERAAKDASQYLERARKVTLRVNPHDYNKLKKEDLLRVMNLPDLNIVEDQCIEISGFILESEKNQIDGQISSQLDFILSMIQNRSCE